MPNLASSFHAQTKPPGIIMLYWSADWIMDQFPWLSHPIGEWSRSASTADPVLINHSDAALASNAMVSFLVPIISALALLPAYGFASRRWGSMAGWIAAGLVALIPGRMAFAPQMDTLYVFFAVMALYLVDTGLIRGRLIWIFGAGLLLSIASFMSPANLVVAVLLGLYIIFNHYHEREGSIYPKALVRPLAALGAGAMVVWAIYWVLIGISFFDILRATDRDLVLLGRSYWFWLVGNLVDFVLLAGLPSLILAASWPFLRRHSKLPQAVAALAISFWITLLLLDISGIIRAETGRIWLMLAPFPAILAGIWVVYVTFEPGIASPIQRSRTLRGGLYILIATAMISLAIGLRWHVLVLEWPNL
jgi:hypothetical protein